jgi:hypothetical protein
MLNDNKSTKVAAANPERTKRHPLFGALKGSTFIPPGVDLTEPTDPDWAELIERRWPLRSRER